MQILHVSKFVAIRLLLQSKSCASIVMIFYLTFCGRGATKVVSGDCSSFCGCVMKRKDVCDSEGNVFFNSCFAVECMYVFHRVLSGSYLPC